MTQERIQARVFGELAEDYDRLRPEYPAAMIQEVLAYAGRIRTALEVGAGTGKATRAFADDGIFITALEPDREMAAILRRRNIDNVTVIETPFEDHRPGAFDLLFSAQAWHWTDPATRWDTAAAAVKPDGTFALFWNNDRLADPAALEQMAPVYAEHAPHLLPNTELIAEAALSTEWPADDLGELTTFGDQAAHLYRWQRTLTAGDYLDYIATHSSYRMLDRQIRERLFADLRSTLPEQITVGIDTVLYLARRLAN